MFTVYVFLKVILINRKLVSAHAQRLWCHLCHFLCFLVERAERKEDDNEAIVCPVAWYTFHFSNLPSNVCPQYTVIDRHKERQCADNAVTLADLLSSGTECYKRHYECCHADLKIVEAATQMVGPATSSNCFLLISHFG